MFVSKKLFFTSLQFCSVVVCIAEIDYFDLTSRPQDDYVDPHSFHYDKHTKTEHRPSGPNNNHDVGEWKGCNAGEVSACYRKLHKCQAAKNTDIAEDLFSRRFVNILVSKAKFEKNGLDLTGRINLEITPMELETLKKFGLGKITVREADTILTKAIQTPPWEPVHDFTLWIRNTATFVWEATTDYLWLHQEKVAGFLLLVYLHYQFRGSRYNSLIALTFGFQLLFVASFFITWWKLVQDARIRHMILQMKYIKMPAECQPHTMGLFEWARSWFYTDNCEDYFQARMSEPLLEVTPAQAMAHMLSTVIYVPVDMGGKIIGKFLNNITAHMPWYIATIVQVGICLGFFPMMILIMMVLLGGSIGFGPFSMLSVTGPRNGPAIRNAESVTTRRDPIEIILTLTTGQNTPGSTNALASSVNLSLSGGDGSSNKDTKEEKMDTLVAAGGDSESTKRPESSQKSDEEATEGRVHRRYTLEVGSGDH